VPDISDQHLKHLEFLQDIVTRMAGNSMTAKGWSVAVTAAIVGLAAAEHTNPRFVLLAFFPPLAFWAVDGYYMYLERCYRDRFDAVRNVTDADWAGFDLSPLTANRGYFVDGLLRPAVWSVHLLILIVALAAWCIVSGVL
jgi:hypothetical protein